VNKTIDGLHVNEIYKSFVYVNAGAKFCHKTPWTVWTVTS